ncbi:hypothetical protein JXA63_02095 [Candidatus Woesebacteria bacterium]|nr:hypothetical protein [Candidatus Woesebacteria bacterium]
MNGKDLSNDQSEKQELNKGSEMKVGLNENGLNTNKVEGNDLPSSEVAKAGKTEYKKSRLINKKEPMLKKFKKDGPGKNIGMFIGIVLVVFAGIGSGWFLSGSSAKQTGSEPVSEVIQEDNGKTAGIPIQNNEDKFDEAEGILESGGIDGEGTHHLVREGGPTKYVYLTSITLDLESFVGKTVLVKGETMAAQSAPWLMDVWVIKEIK